MKRTPEEETRYVEEFRASLEEGERLVRGKGKRMSPILMDARGIDGHLVLLDNGIRIKRSDPVFLDKGVKGDREIAFSQVASIQLKKAGTFSSGYIELLLQNGGGETNGRGDNSQGENRVLFKASQQQDFESIKQAIEEKLTAVRSAPAPPQTRTAAAQNIQNIPYIEELEKLASLRDRGIISEEEFTVKKRQILGI